MGLQADREALADNDILLVTPKKKPVGGELSERERAHNRRLCAKRAKGEHPFRIVKCVLKLPQGPVSRLVVSACQGRNQ